MDLHDLKSAFEDYSDAAENQLVEMKHRLADVETQLARPGAQAHKSMGGVATEHKSAFLRDFMVKGNDDALRRIEMKALSTTTGGDGGYAVPEMIDAEIETQLLDLSPMRQICKVRMADSGDYKRLVSRGGAASGWVGDVDARSETGTPSLEEVAIAPGELYANAAATQRALDDFVFDAESWLMEEVADEFARQEGAAIIGGDGVNKPKGFLTYPTLAEDDKTRAFGIVEHIATGADGAFAATDPSDQLVDLVHSLNSRYRKGATFVMNSKTLATVRKFKDADGNFIWRPGLIEGRPDTLLGYPIVEAEDMPDIASDSLSIAFGNFERAYTIVERLGTRVLRDPYSNKPFVQFYATRRVGGALVNDNALKLLKFSAV